MKAQIWVSVIIYTMVALLALVLVLNTGLPLINEMREKSSFNKISENMQELDSHIKDFSKQGEGSQSEISFDVKDGLIKFHDNALIWEYESGTKILPSRTSSKVGNLIISVNSNVKTEEYDDYYILSTQIKNDTFSVRLKKFHSRENPGVINTSQIIEYISYNGMQITGFDFFLNGNESSSIGTGFTELIPNGNNSNLGKAKVLAYVDSSFAKYKLEFILESYADFLTIKVKNIEPK